MRTALLEPLIGVVDGVNKVFSTRVPYRLGSVLPVVGITLGLGEWTELGASEIRLVNAPLPGDVVAAWYRPL